MGYKLHITRLIIKKNLLASYFNGGTALFYLLNSPSSATLRYISVWLKVNPPILEWNGMNSAHKKLINKLNSLDMFWYTRARHHGKGRACLGFTPQTVQGKATNCPDGTSFLSSPGRAHYSNRLAWKVLRYIFYLSIIFAWISFSSTRVSTGDIRGWHWLDYLII